VSCGAAFAPSNPFPDLSPAYRGQPSSRRPVRAGFTKSSTTAFGSSQRSGDRVQLVTCAGNNFASRFPLIAAAIAALPVRSCVIDGEAIACDENGMSVFELLRYQRRDQVVTLCAFDLMELDGEDLRRMPIEHRKSTLLRLIRDRHPGIVFNAHYIVDGAIVFKNACALGCEGIVSKRLGSTYRAGRSPHWLKVKNPKAPAVKREVEEDWSA